MTKHDINPEVLKNMNTISESDLCGLDARLDDFKCLWYLVTYVYRPEAKPGMDVTGLSFRQSGKWERLTVKATIDGIPQVVFISDPTTMGCVRSFIRLWFSGGLTWYPDKFA